MNFLVGINHHAGCGEVMGGDSHPLYRPEVQRQRGAIQSRRGLRTLKIKDDAFRIVSSIGVELNLAAQQDREPQMACRRLRFHSHDFGKPGR